MIIQYKITRMIKMFQNRSGTACTPILPRFTLTYYLQFFRLCKIYKFCYFSGFGKFCLKIVKRNVEYTICFFAVINKGIVFVVIISIGVIKADDSGVLRKVFME